MLTVCSAQKAVQTTTLDASHMMSLMTGVSHGGDRLGVCPFAIGVLGGSGVQVQHRKTRMQRRAASRMHVRGGSISRTRSLNISLIFSFDGRLNKYLDVSVHWRGGLDPLCSN